MPNLDDERIGTYALFRSAKTRTGHYINSNAPLYNGGHSQRHLPTSQFQTTQSGVWLVYCGGKRERVAIMPGFVSFQAYLTLLLIGWVQAKQIDALQSRKWNTSCVTGKLAHASQIEALFRHPHPDYMQISHSLWFTTSGYHHPKRLSISGSALHETFSM